MGEEIYYRGGKDDQVGDEIIIDPASLNLDELPIQLAMAGWTVMVGYPEVDGGELSVRLFDMGGANGKTGAEVALSLNIIDAETGELLPGYAVEEQTGRIEVRYEGVADVRFAEFAKALHGLSPWA